MKLIRFIFISIVILFIVITAVSLLFPSTVVVSRAIDISAPKDSVLQYIANIQKWNSWIEGMNDASVTVYSSNKAQLNKTTVKIDSIKNDQVFTSWIGSNGRSMQSVLQIIVSSNNNASFLTLHWQFVQQVHWYPWEKFASLMNDKILGTMMEKNLVHLKDCAEKGIHL